VSGEDYALSLLSGEDYALSLLRRKLEAEIVLLEQLGGRSNRMASFEPTVRLFAKFTWGEEEHTLPSTLAETIAREAIHLRRIQHLKDVLGPMVWGYTGFVERSNWLINAYDGLIRTGCALGRHRSPPFPNRHWLIFAAHRAQYAIMSSP
jgi:hypothetical protein